VTYVAAPAASRRGGKKPSPVIVALAVTACIAAGGGGYLLLSGSSSSDNSSPPPVVHRAPARTATTAAPTAAEQAAAAQALLSRSVAAAQARGSFASTDTGVQDGLTETSYSWTGATTAAATVEIAGKGQVTVRIVGPAAYLTGDGPALQALTGDADFGEFLGGKWLEIAKGDEGYDDIMGEATDGKGQDWFSGTVTQLPTTTLNGQRVIPLRGTPASDEDAGPHATATLYVAADGDPLPVRYDVTSDTGHDVATFNGWGSSQTVLAPPVAIDAAWLVNAAAAEAAHPCGCAAKTSIT
jgi:hypothetical protein